MALPPTSRNSEKHVLRAHLNVMLLKLELREGISVPVIAESDLAPPEVLDVIDCHCKARGKKCSCSCHKQICHVHHTATVLLEIPALISENMKQLKRKRMT